MHRSRAAGFRLTSAPRHRLKVFCFRLTIPLYFRTSLRGDVELQKAKQQPLTSRESFSPLLVFCTSLVGMQMQSTSRSAIRARTPGAQARQARNSVVRAQAAAQTSQYTRVRLKTRSDCEFATFRVVGQRDPHLVCVGAISGLAKARASDGSTQIYGRLLTCDGWSWSLNGISNKTRRQKHHTSTV